MTSAVVQRSPPTLIGAAASHSGASDAVGALEVVTAARIAGWAADRRAFDRHVEVEIRIGEEVIARVDADRQRGDLARAGLGNGIHGFEWRPAEPIPVERLAQVEAFALMGADGGRTIPLPKRRPDGTFPPSDRPASPPAWISELSALCQQIERHARRLDTSARQIDPGVHGGGKRRRCFASSNCWEGSPFVWNSLDGLQLRLDEVAAHVERLAETRLGSGKARHGLACAVALTAVIAAGSLGVGIWNYFG